MKIKLSKTQWEDMGRKAGWMKNVEDNLAFRLPDAADLIGGKGLCPICGIKVTVTGVASDGRAIGSCKDAFTVKQWTKK